MDKKTVLITGGAGFIGTNATAHYLRKRYRVIVYDNLSRAGAKQNLDWLKGQKGNFIFVKGDVRNYKKLLEVFEKYKPDFIIHLAAQVTMVTSVTNPGEDFEINALGTFNVLEALRKGAPQASLIYSSTNKVYGEMADIPVMETRRRYIYKDIKGISEDHKLDFHGPYGCSKGAGDQYTLDYARIYGLNTVVYRQSGIYGPHQFGIEEQGWLAWFCNALLFDKPVTIYGDGKQVRDVLYIDDLLKAFDFIFKNIEKTRGRAYNIGGGSKLSLSIWELFDILEKLSGKKINYSFDAWRAGDQRIYISDLTNIKKDLSWAPKISPKEGVKRLYNWISQNKNLIKKAGVFKN